jgi:acetyl esterase/lipase
VDWDDAYSNTAHIPGGEEFPPRWAAHAAAYCAAAKGAEIDLAYGGHPRELVDIFHPEGEARGLAVFVHGGYWMAFDKSTWSHLAEGARRRGWAVALPSYVLAPEARIGAITGQIARAISFAAARVAGPIRLSGHSAGGHLVSRMVCEGGPLDEGTAARVERVVSISGLHDLQPLLRTAMNATLGLTEAEARAESAALTAPRPGARVTAWVGAAERPEFLRQSELLVEAWGDAAKLVVDPERHHFDVIDGLADPDSALAREFAE